MATREKKKDQQVSNEVISSRLAEASENIQKRTKSLTDSYKQIKIAIGNEKFADDAYAHLKSNLDGSDIKKNSKDLSIAISVAIRDSNSHVTQDDESFKSFMDKKKKSIIKQLETADQMSEKLKRLTLESRKVRMELAKGEKKPESLLENINREVNDPLADHPQDIYLGLAISEFVFRKLDEIAKARNSGEIEKTKSMVKRFSDPKEVENELINGHTDVQSEYVPQQVNPEVTSSDKQIEKASSQPVEKAHSSSRKEHVAEPKSSDQEQNAQERHRAQPKNVQEDNSQQTRRTEPNSREKIPRSQWPAGDWVSHVKEYYKHFEEWAELDEEEKARMKSLIKELDRTNSMATAIKLWKEVNTKWLERTNTLGFKVKDQFAEDIRNANTSEEATKTSRRMLVHHANHYTQEFSALFDGELAKRRKEILEELEKNKKLDAEQFRIILEHDIGKRLDEEMKARLKIQNADENDKQRLWAEYANEQEITSKFLSDLGDKSTSDFHYFFTKMNESHLELDYENNGLMWDYMYRFAFSAWRRNTLPNDGVNVPPPLEFPKGTKENPE